MARWRFEAVHLDPQKVSSLLPSFRRDLTLIRWLSWPFWNIKVKVIEGGSLPSVYNEFVLDKRLNTNCIKKYGSLFACLQKFDIASPSLSLSLSLPLSHLYKHSGFSSYARFLEGALVFLLYTSAVVTSKQDQWITLIDWIRLQRSSWMMRMEESQMTFRFESSTPLNVPLHASEITQTLCILQVLP